MAPRPAPIVQPFAGPRALPSPAWAEPRGRAGCRASFAAPAYLQIPASVGRAHAAAKEGQAPPPRRRQGRPPRIKDGQARQAARPLARGRHMPRQARPDTFLRRRAPGWPWIPCFASTRRATGATCPARSTASYRGGSALPPRASRASSAHPALPIRRRTSSRQPSSRLPIRTRCSTAYSLQGRSQSGSEARCASSSSCRPPSSRTA